MHLRDIVISQIKNKYPDSDAYVEGKTQRLQELSNFEVLFWATHALDTENQGELCRTLGISLEDFRATTRVMKVIYNL